MTEEEERKLLKYAKSISTNTSILAFIAIVMVILLVISLFA